MGPESQSVDVLVDVEWLFAPQVSDVWLQRARQLPEPDSAQRLRRGLEPSLRGVGPAALFCGT